MNYKVGSLFAGVGGIDLGFQKATFKEDQYDIIWANEIDEYAVETYRHNFDHQMFHGDIEKIVKPEREVDEEERMKYIQMQKDILGQRIDVLVGGFPCQAFSIAGFRKGFDDERGNLFWSIVDLIRLLDESQGKPSVLCLENVKNLKTHDNGRTYKVIKNQLEYLGYTVKEKVINTKDVTRLPQNRERIYIVAFLDSKVADHFTLFEEIDKFKLTKSEEQRREDIRSVLDLNLTKEDSEKYYYTKEKYPSYFLTEEEYLSMDAKERREQRVNIEEQIDEEYEFYQVRRGMYVRKNKNGVCPTLTANMGTGGHNVPLIKVKDGVRKLTPAETFKIQGFPIGFGYTLPTEYKGRDFSDGRLYKQAGNAVSVDVVSLIAKEILKALTSNKAVEKDVIHS
ncbi:DNA (cytosine-5-)-methyltransferase [Neobacillus sp. SuZ13]|uniref:DNA (cytosine-5-)-methyltransferase n=1 Tax=Neobacillus sp. SuZ13 TaxID=3047875 RepID=UPI0024C074F7|nr:DNA (cytosine-5-)-methyltransferase [Neobacillus sp. SuZ13]WHY65630.1 DNA (cytosine-5-)-methyltransferase [Neobacillus sp. SuZ13]